MSKSRTLMAFASGALALSLAAPVAFADSNSLLERLFGGLAQNANVRPEVSIAQNGMVLVRGAKVTSVSGSTIQAGVTFGSFTMNWTVKTSGDTEFVRYHGGRGTISDVAVGHIISFRGKLDTTASSATVNAGTVRNWSVQKVQVSRAGEVKSVNSSNSSFVLRVGNQDVTVATNASTTITRNGVAGTFSSIQVGSRAQVTGLWDSVANTFEASAVVITTPVSERIFENGTFKSMASTTAPTTMVVAFGGTDYTVKVATDTAIINRNWLRTTLSSFQAGDAIRVYGLAEGTTIDAIVIRNTSLPR